VSGCGNSADECLSNEKREKKMSDEPKALDIDRSDVPLKDAISGHWYIKEYRKNSYFLVGPNDTVLMAWDARGGLEKSSIIYMSTYKIDNDQNYIVTVHKSESGEYTYYYKYAFDSSKTTMTIQQVEENMEPSICDEESVAFYVDETPNPLIELINNHSS
jgi:hypothetical protein